MNIRSILRNLNPSDRADAGDAETAFPGGFPMTRLRRSRGADWSRRLVREHRLSPDDFIWPVFVQEGTGQADPVEAMPGVTRLSIDRVVDAVGEAKELGIPAVAIFPAIDSALKSDEGTEAQNPDNLVCRAVKAV